jgi:hypothetical protein
MAVGLSPIRYLARGVAQREGLKPEGVETWNKARCAARKPVPGTAGASMQLEICNKFLTGSLMNDYQNTSFWH